MFGMRALSDVLAEQDDYELAHSLEDWLTDNHLYPGEPEQLMWFVHLERFEQLCNAVSNVAIDDTIRLICLQYAFKPLNALKQLAMTDVQQAFVKEQMMKLLVDGRFLHQYH
ncbi:hypothetical protein ACFSJ3_07470 [Corallincola platygyrae]|uniref:Uncharacterized protein n=1 Tax=Corallincola platygyrae TaxID=1193278 RepID=A0ABW4XJT6_9GAMM